MERFVCDLTDPRMRGDDVKKRGDDVKKRGDDVKKLGSSVKKNTSSLRMQGSPSIAITFLAGDLFLQHFSYLPSLKWLGIILCLTFIIRKTRYFNLIFAFLLGVTYTTWYASSILSWSLPKLDEDKPLQLIGYVASMPVIDKDVQRFIFQLKNSNVKIRLYWKTNQNLRVGDEWNLQAKLKRIHATQNPGSKDFEAMAFQRHIRATGTVIQSETTHLEKHHYLYPVEQLRQIIKHNIQPLLPHTNTAPWLMALMIGERDEVNPSDWEILRRTGTNHLMAIGGLHIGMLAGFIFLLCEWCWRLSSRLTMWLPSRIAGAYAALIIAFMYAALSGFEIPAQRACSMLSIFTIAFVCRRNFHVWDVWSLGLLIVLLLNPLTVLNESFWLSFGTIALIIYGMSARVSPSGCWWKWGRVQWVIGVGLIPLSLLFFQQVSLMSFLANSIAIPWLECVILPFCILSLITLTFSHSLTALLLWLADKSLTLLWKVLLFFAHFNAGVVTQNINNPILLLLGIFGIAMLLLPSGMLGRYLGIFFILPVFFNLSQHPQPGEVWLSLLDVGQGLSTVIQTEKHILVFDAGPSSAKMDAGENIVLPYLRFIGVKQIDMLIISHGDNDHRGGAAALLKAMAIKSVKTSVPEKISTPVTSSCLAGMHWQWDDVNFEFISPYPDTLHLGNNSSCVLRIKSKSKTILLTGDIEQPAEQVILQRSANLLAANVLIAPHHGSKTSSTDEFIEAVHPEYVLYATGYLNRYHFPHDVVIEKYYQQGVEQLNTVDTGVIKIKVTENKIVIDRYRIDQRKYWWD